MYSASTLAVVPNLIVQQCPPGLAGRVTIYGVGHANLSKAEDGQGLADEGDSHILAALPLPTLHGGIGLSHVAAEGCHECNAVLCRCHCVGGGRIHDQAPVLQGTGCGLNLSMGHHPEWRRCNNGATLPCCMKECH